MSEGVLVGCPNYAGKTYSLERWRDAFIALDYPDKHAFMVDNTRPDFTLVSGFHRQIEALGIECVHIDPVGDFDMTFFECWKLILAQAKRLGCAWVYSVEADNIVPPDSLSLMVEVAHLGKLSVVTMPYRAHGRAALAMGRDPEQFWYNELGCMLVATEHLERALGEWDAYANVSVAIFSVAHHGQPPAGYARLSPNLFEVEHLDGLGCEFQNLPVSRNGLTFSRGDIERET